MAVTELRSGARSLFLEGPDLVEREKTVFRSHEKRIPLTAISSLGIERKANAKLVVAAVVVGVLGLGGLGSDSAGVGLFLLMVAGVLAFGFWQTRKIILVVESVTGRIEFPSSGQNLQAMEQFIAEAHRARMPATEALQ